jgi:hypothetical protein
MPRLSEFWRSIDPSPWRGYVVGESDAIVLLQSVSDRLDLDGYCALVREHITSEVQDFEKRDVIERALRLRQQKPVHPSRIAVDSLVTLVESAQAQYDVVVLDREVVAPGEVQVGSVRLNTAETYVLRWMTVNGHWENDSRVFSFRDVTRVEFGGEYEQTLLRVAQQREADG